MSWTNVKLIFCRELRDQMRDRRTLFTIVVLPLLLYPVLAMLVFQVQQFRKEYPSRVKVIGAEGLTASPHLFQDGHLSPSVCPQRETHLLDLDLSTAAEPHATSETVVAAAKADLRTGRWDAVVYFPPEFSRRLAAARAAESPPSEV